MTQIASYPPESQTPCDAKRLKSPVCMKSTHQISTGQQRNLKESITVKSIVYLAARHNYVKVNNIPRLSQTQV